MKTHRIEFWATLSLDGKHFCVANDRGTSIDILDPEIAEGNYFTVKLYAEVPLPDELPPIKAIPLTSK